MGKKKEYSFVVGEFLKGGCVLLAKTYKNRVTPMEYICECKRLAKIRYSHFTKGVRCMKCRVEKQTLTLNAVRKDFVDRGHVLLEETYINNRRPMRYICQCGNKSTISHNSLVNGKRCMLCSGKRLTIQHVRREFLDNGCKLLEEEYKNNTILMNYICECGNKTKISRKALMNQQRCVMCKNKTERIVNGFLEDQYSNIIPQPKFEWCKAKRLLPFDFLLDDLKILIEVDGPQHFRQVSNWGSPEEALERDIYKTKLALRHGYSLIRISQADIKANTVDWQEMINDEVKEYSQPTCVYISKDPELYNKHKALL